jgi:NitT/TauT family transport system substrate-binding protein
VKQLRLIHFPAVCLTFGYLAEDLLKAEGFEEVQYLEVTVNTVANTIATGHVDIWMDAAPSLTNLLATSDAVVALAGVHAGCYELFGNARVRTISDLKNKSVSISTLGSTEHIFVASVAAYVGLDPRRDIHWVVTGNTDDAVRAFTEGRADAFLGFAPQPHELRSRGIGHVILNTTQDRPWSQYFCCMVTANREFARHHPIATRRALRAFLKAADICASDPARAARFMVDRGYEPRYELALEIIRGLPYRRWREANPEDTLRFHALRLREGGLITTTPDQLIARGTDWSFLNRLKQELKA